MMLRLFTVLFAFCLSFNASAQEVFTGKPTKSTPFKQALDAQFYNYNVYEIDIQTIDKYVKSEGNQASLKLQLGAEHDWTLHLSSFDLRSSDYVLTVGGEEGKENDHGWSADTYKGIEGTNASDVAVMTVREDYFSVVVFNSETTWFLEAVRYLSAGAPENLFVVYKSDDVIPQEDNSCMAIHVDKKSKEIFDSNQVAVAESSACKEVQIAIAADVAMFDKYGSVGAVNAHTTNILTLVQTNYDDEFADELMFVIATQYVETVSNPWGNSSNAGTLLSSFRSWGNGGGFGVTYDVAGLWTDVNLNGSTIGIAYLNGICNNNRYHVCQDFTGNTNLLRVLWAHELGHNFSCTHDPSGSPTIMAPAVNGSNAWSAQSVSQVNNYVPTRSCLGVCLGAAPPVANFSLSPPIGCAPLTVDCIDLSTNNPTEWDWTVTLNGVPVFTSTAQNPTFTLVNAGCYQITLIASNGVGSSVPFSQMVTVDATPNTNFIWTNIGTAVIFQNLTVPNDPCLSPTIYTWNFGDGNTSNEFEPTHVYVNEGFYTVILTATNPCGTSTFVQEVAAFFPPSANFTADPTIGCPLLTVDYVNTSSLNSLSAFWVFEGGDPSSSTDFDPSVNYDTPGTYDVTLEVCNPAGCDVLIMPDFITVLDHPEADAGPSMTLDCLNDEVELDGTGSESGANFTYEWTTDDGNIVSGANTLTPTVDAAGEYCLEIMNLDGENCVGFDCVEVFENMLAPIADAGPNQTIDCNSLIALLDGTGSSEGPLITYEWSGPSIISGANTMTPEVDEEGIYTILVTNTENGCTEEAETEVITDFALPIANAGPAMTIDCNNTEVTLDGSNSSQGSEFTYEWSGPGIVFGETTLFPLVNSIGLYELVVTDTENGCTESSQVQVDENFVLPVADGGPSMTIDCDETTVILDGTGSSQGSNYTYSWSGPEVISGGNTMTPTVGAEGTYTIVVTNTLNGCTEVADAIVSEDVEAPTANAGPTMELNCSITSVNLDGTGSSQGGNYTYEWIGPGIVSGESTLEPVVNMAGNYTITVTNTDNGCTETSSTEVTGDNSIPTANAGPTQVLDCNNSTIDLDGTGSSQGNGETYSWAGPGIVSGGNTMTPEVNMNGTYTITVTGTNGCTETSSVEVSEDFGEPTADAGDNVVVACSATSAELDGTGSSQGANFTYDWDGPEILSGETTLEPTVGQTGTYTLTVLNTTNGCTSTSEVEVTETPPPSADISTQTNVDCNGNNTGEATVDVTGGLTPYSYAWSSGGTEATETGLPAGTHEVTVTDADMCETIAEVTITQPDVLDANASSTNLTSVGADDGSATADPAGGTAGYSYEWEGGQSTQTINNLAPGEYTVTVTDANGCTDVQTVTVEPFDCSPVGLDVSGTNALCNGSFDGEATASGTNGENPFSYEWSSGHNTATASGLAAGTYTVTATDNNGCVLVDEITISEPTVLESDITSSENIDCNGNSTGSATVAADGGTPGYSYEWSTGGTDPTETGMPAGTHTVTVTDDHGCETISEVNLTEPNMLEANETSSNETGVGSNDGTATANPTGGTAGYTYMWSNGETSQTIENLSPGEYCVTVMDANGCVESGCTTVNSFDCGAITSEFDVVQVSCFGDENGEATVNMNGGTLPYSYEWSNGATGVTAVNLAAGEYEVTATDDNNCVIISNVTVPQPDMVEVGTTTQTDVECEGEMNGSATVAGSGGNGGFSYMWSDGTMGETISNVGAGVYTVVATDNLGCTGETEVEIAVQPDTEAPVVMTQDIEVVLDDDGMFTLTPGMIDNGTTDNCELVSVSLDITDLNCDHVGQITVTLTGTDASGNSSSATATVTVLDETPPTMTCPDDIITNNCSAPITYPVPTGEDLCGLVTVSLNDGPASGSVFPTGETTVTWSGTDPSGNETTCSFTVTVESDLQTGIESVAPDCNGNETGSALANPSGGTAPFTYQWDDPNMQITQEAINLGAGTYNVTVTDNVGCIVTSEVDVDEPTAVESVLDDLVDETGQNGDGSISITPTGGTGSGYTFNWTFDGNPFSTDEDLTGLSAGEYCVEIYDGNQCIGSDCYTVDMINNTTNPELESQISVTPNPTQGMVNVNFQLNDSRNVKVDWYDVIGRQIIEGDRHIVTEKSFNFDLSHVAAGVYLVRITVDEDVLVKKVVVE